MCALCCIIFICVEITKETECRRIKTPSGKTRLAIVIVGLAVVIVGLALTSPLVNSKSWENRLALPKVAEGRIDVNET
jgi:hypothetical protein